MAHDIKITAYKGFDPDDNTPTFLVTLGTTEFPDKIDCFAGEYDDNAEQALNDSDAVLMALQLGIWRAGKAQPVAFKFLEDPRTEQLWQVTSPGELRQ